MSVDQEIREQRELLDQMDRGDPAREGNGMDCKIAGCTLEATAAKGPYAGLCDEHAEVARQKRVENARGGGGANGKGIAGQLRAILPLATKVDRGRAKLAALPEASQQHAELDEAIRRVQGARTPENLARLIEITKGAVKGQAPRERIAKELATAEREFKTRLAEVVRSTTA